MRRAHHGLDVYLGDDLIGHKAKVVYDPARHTVVVSQRDERRRWSDTHTFEGVTNLSSEKVGREMVYSWTGDGVAVTGVKAGCGCGGKR